MAYWVVAWRDTWPNNQQIMPHTMYTHHTLLNFKALFFWSASVDSFTKLRAVMLVLKRVLSIVIQQSNSLPFRQPWRWQHQQFLICLLEANLVLYTLLNVGIWVTPNQCYDAIHSNAKCHQPLAFWATTNPIDVSSFFSVLWISKCSFQFIFQFLGDRWCHCECILLFGFRSFQN